ncbi:MAG TPA: EAL domain-containing protein, partial [Gammaproteobacteria bacterium]|nr:EAL domain-containing protein [Gammaproteobacteria bacterium]
DGNLIRDICSDAVDCTMVESINSMAQLLDIRTIAESVDGEAELEKLKAIGIDYAQGYYLGELVRIDDIGSLAPENRLIENQID